MDAKARQDCIKEIDLLKVKNQRGGRRRHAPCSVLLRCLSWDLPPQKNNWSAPDCLDFGSGVWGCAHCARLLAWIWMQRSILCTRVRILVCVCVCWTSLKSLQAHVDFFFFFLMPKLLLFCFCFFFFFIFYNVSTSITVDQQENLGSSTWCFTSSLSTVLSYFLFWRKWFHLSNCHKTRVRWVALK